MTDPLRMGYVAQLTTTAVEPLSMSMYASSADYWRARAEAAEKDAARYRTALEKIQALDPERDSTEGFNEWGEADCFRQAQGIATTAIKTASQGTP